MNQLRFNEGPLAAALGELTKLAHTLDSRRHSREKKRLSDESMNGSFFGRAAITRLSDPIRIEKSLRFHFGIDTAAQPSLKMSLRRFIEGLGAAAWGELTRARSHKGFAAVRARHGKTLK